MVDLWVKMKYRGRWSRMNNWLAVEMASLHRQWAQMDNTDDVNIIEVIVKSLEWEMQGMSMWTE